MKPISYFFATLVISIFALAQSKVVYSDYDNTLGLIKLDNACITRHHVRTIKPISVCRELTPEYHPGRGEQSGYTDWTCARAETSHLEISRHFEKSVCAEFSYEADNFVCLRMETVRAFIPATIKTAEVSKPFSSNTNFPGVTKYVTLPDCQP
jgi:hypothetical protein